MTTVLNTTPMLKKDANLNVIQDSYTDRAFQGEYTGANIIYKGFARPGTPTTSTGWQIAFMTYSGSNLVSITWPLNSSGSASNDYEFTWSARATYTYV